MKISKNKYKMLNIKGWPQIFQFIQFKQGKTFLLGQDMFSLRIKSPGCKMIFYAQGFCGDEMRQFIIDKKYSVIFEICWSFIRCACLDLAKSLSRI